MERRITTVDDFNNVARNNEYFLWHFLQKKQSENSLTLFSYFETREDRENPINLILDNINVPYFESYVEDSVDFLQDIGISHNLIWEPLNLKPYVDPNYFFKPVIIGFKKFTKVTSTFEHCYCTEGLIDVIGDLNPELLLPLSVEKEDLE
jgi:hypothetical protein